MLNFPILTTLIYGRIFNCAGYQVRAEGVGFQQQHLIYDYIYQCNFARSSQYIHTTIVRKPLDSILGRDSKKTESAKSRIWKKEMKLMFLILCFFFTKPFDEYFFWQRKFFPLVGLWKPEPKFPSFGLSF